MFAKRLLQKVTNNNLSPSSSSSQNARRGSVAPMDLDPRILLHYGIPSTASVLAFDPIQGLMAIGTLDGRIKVMGGDSIQGLFISPHQLPYKSLEFLQNKGFLVSVSNNNAIQVWDLDQRCIACSLQWESNITAFSVIHGTYFMYIGDDCGLMSVLKYNAEEGKIVQLPYHIPANSVAEAAGISIANHQSIVGVLLEPCASERQDIRISSLVHICVSLIFFFCRVLIAYEKGLIILWDVSEAQVVCIRGYKDLQLRDGEVDGSSKGSSSEILDDISDHEQEDKEISSLCWASSDGSILAVGYVDGDIMLWNMSCASANKSQQTGVSSNDVVKLQLSSGERRLPVIVLHWSACGSSGGQLFIYGGDEIGSEEVLTVLSLEWMSGRETLRCVSRVDLTLDGSFSDLILVPSGGAMKNPSDTLFVLTNPGQLQVYDDSILLALSSQQEKKPSVPAIQFPVVVPTLDPYMTVAKLSLLPIGGISSKALIEMTSVMDIGAAPTLRTGSKWPLTGGASSQTSSSEDNRVERLYMAGYQDGSTRIWNATHAVLSLMLVLKGEVDNVKVAGANASVSALDFCPLTLSLAVGNECGLVRVYKLSGSPGATDLHFVAAEEKHEVHKIHQEKGLQCTAVFSVLSSPIRTLQYASSGAKLALGFACGRVGMLDMRSSSVLFLTDPVSSSSSPVISLTEMAFSDIYNSVNSPKHQESKNTEDPADVIFILTRDLHLVIVDSVSESCISVSETSKEKYPEQLSKSSPTQIEPIEADNHSGETRQEVELNTSSETATSGESSSDSLILLCSVDALRLFSLRSLLKGDCSSIHKVSLAKPCSWTTTFKGKDGKACGLALLYQTGVVEIRSLPDLEVVREWSLMSILRWSFKANMEKTICSSENGHIFLVEIPFFFSNYFETLPSLHNKVIAESADATIKFSANQKKKQGTSSGVFGGIIKGIKEKKQESGVDLSGSLTKSNYTQHLEIIFSKAAFPEPSESIKDNDEVLELSIDDIEIDEPRHVMSTVSQQAKNDGRDKETERENLFQGATADAKPRLRKPEEIIAKYRKTGDASTAAAQARDKLIYNGRKNLRGSADVLKNYKMGLKTLHQWQMNLQKYGSSEVVENLIKARISSLLFEIY
ncbi:hypothetical protein IFM89_003974 [Coptis chinensis]|uniref:Uncharacterized protein n=1 Tax=Coptis chinensis TaxID=261450 RepID=A0A835H2G9_9MAGN|nr:hypothetical protein IFM89_003974 [Coptis chinensis]